MNNTTEITFSKSTLKAMSCYVTHSILLMCSLPQVNHKDEFQQRNLLIFADIRGPFDEIKIVSRYISSVEHQSSSKYSNAKPDF